jgi:hypothetical protein
MFEPAPISRSNTATPITTEARIARALTWPPIPGDHAPWKWIPPESAANRATWSLRLCAGLFLAEAVFGATHATVPTLTPFNIAPLAVALFTAAIALRTVGRAALARSGPEVVREWHIDPNDAVRSWWAVPLWPPAPLVALRDTMHFVATRLSTARRVPRTLSRRWWRAIAFFTVVAALIAALRLVAWTGAGFDATSGTWLAVGGSCAAAALGLLAETIRTLAAVTGAPK